MWYTAGMESYLWYRQLLKPAWAPPSWLFGPVWTVLYAIIAGTFGFVFWRWWRGLLPGMVVLPFALNLVFNALFTPLQFGLQSNILAAIDILLVLGTLVWALAAIGSRHPWVAWANVPYLAWVCFATVLQLTITVLNW